MYGRNVRSMGVGIGPVQLGILPLRTTFVVGVECLSELLQLSVRTPAVEPGVCTMYSVQPFPDA